MTEASETSSSSTMSEAQRLKASGNALLTARDYSGAIIAYTEAMALLQQIGVDDNTTKQVGEEPSLRSILLSNRSHAYLSSGCVDKALEDAECCITLQPTWPKAHLRRARALQQQGARYRRDALDAYDDALAAAEHVDGAANSNGAAKKRLIDELKTLRKQCARELRETGSSQLSKEVADMGCLLAVPEGARISESRCLAATLVPSTYDGVDDRTNVPIHATFPGDSGWPMFVPTITHKVTRNPHRFPLCYYIIGPCTLTKACAKEIDDIFRPTSQHACRWPGGEATRTCPFCAGACVPGRGESFTMVVHLLMGKAVGGFGHRLMMQLVCKRCTRKHLLKARHGCEGESEESLREIQMLYDNGKSGGGVDPVPRVRMLTESSHAAKTSALWNRASNTGLITSITLHAQERFQRICTAGGMQAMTTVYNTGSRNAVAETCSKGEFFDTWMSRLDERGIYTLENDFDRVFDASKLHASGSCDTHIRQSMSGPDPGRYMGNQNFHIRQVARINDLQKALNRFWNRHGAGFRLQWSMWDAEEQESFTFETGRAFFERRLEHYNRRQTQYHHIEDPRKLVNKPFGDIPRQKLCFLPELAGSASMGVSTLDLQYDLLQLFRDRTAGGKTWVAEDVALMAQLKKENGLPKIQYKDEDGSYLCDYMGLRDPSIGPFVVLVGEREAEYNAKGTLSLGMLMKPEQVVESSDYRSLREPLSENLTIFNAVADGVVRSFLNNLLDSGTATCAVCYIYAAMRQEFLLEYLQTAAHHYCVLVGKDDPKDLESWTYEETAGCYVCAARTRPDGSKLFCCSKCQNVNYCSKECQKTDWKRHKAESCVSSPNFVPNGSGTKSVAPVRAQKSKKKGKRKKNGKKNGKK